LEAFEVSHGCRLPPDFVAHATGRFGGLWVEVKETLWPRPRAYDFGEFWSFLYALHTYGLNPGIIDSMNLEAEANRFRELTGHELIPCLRVVGDANIYLMDSVGEILQWDHEIEELLPVRMSFFELLDRELGELRQRKDWKKAGGRAA
jgi:hypothetical protein